MDIHLYGICLAGVQFICTSSCIPSPSLHVREGRFSAHSAAVAFGNSPTNLPLIFWSSVLFYPKCTAHILGLQQQQRETGTNS